MHIPYNHIYVKQKFLQREEGNAFNVNSFTWWYTRVECFNFFSFIHFCFKKNILINLHPVQQMCILPISDSAVSMYEILIICLYLNFQYLEDFRVMLFSPISFIQIENTVFGLPTVHICQWLFQTLLYYVNVIKYYYLVTEIYLMGNIFIFSYVTF